MEKREDLGRKMVEQKPTDPTELKRYERDRLMMEVLLDIRDELCKLNLNSKVRMKVVGDPEMVPFGDVE